MSLLKKIAKLRQSIADLNLEPTGENQKGYKYYELKDFLPTVMEIEKDLKMMSIYSLKKECAVLNVFDLESDDEEYFHLYHNVQYFKTMQDIGALNTYLKRYLYINYLNLIQNDEVEFDTEQSLVGPCEGNPGKKATINQLTLIKEHFSVKEIQSIVEQYGIKSIEYLSYYDAANEIQKKIEAGKYEK